MSVDQCREFAKQLSASLVQTHEFLKCQMRESLGIELESETLFPEEQG
jgi:hypothetical protein